ncbi:hypothetical protein [Aliikangiella coralliicola]|uniref:Uncharacterized protein n=1 Tax=Aliikangiella coralliicola TaxID=2592383 RepID=A0A545UEY6_9GAMM|nr:hypothetical protein [Aliikangiella coralliicola]TQV88040.1 hypothetical protein FLL46_09535 [Aliikangiella coralliicola]
MVLSLTTCSSVFAQPPKPDTVDKKWRSAMLISHPYSKNLDQAINAVNLSVDNNQAVFEVLSRATKENVQPDRILWTMEVEPETKFFRLRNLKNDLYLSRIDGSNEVTLMNKPPKEHVLSQWFVQSLTVEGDYAIVNRSGDQDYALNLGDSFSAGQVGNTTPVTLEQINDEQSTALMYRMDSRFLNATLYPLDIEKGTCLVFLPTGVPLESFTNPSPSQYFPGSVTRRYKISIKGSGSDVYHFIDGLGFDPLGNDLTSQQQTLLVNLKSRTADLKIVVENNLNVDEVFQSFKEQLSKAYRDSQPISILYFPDSYSAIEADKAAGKIEKEHTIIEEKRLGMRVTINQSLSASYSYGLLAMKSGKNGVEEVVIVDPTDTTKPTKPRF